jgi:hypothetical protein
VAEQAPSVRGSLSSGYVTDEDAGLREIEILITPDEYRKLKRGVAYKLLPANEKESYKWQVRKDLRITIE